MRISLDTQERTIFFKCAYPARTLLTLNPHNNAVENIIGYNSRAKIFNLFAGEPHIDKPTLCLTYDQDTDDLELIVAWLDVAGRECLYLADNIESADTLCVCHDYYSEHRQELADERKAITKRILEELNNG